jgi:hypothetical protein
MAAEVQGMDLVQAFSVESSAAIDAGHLFSF